METQAFLTFLTDANLKNLIYSFFCDDTIPLRSFELGKKLLHW